MDEKEVLLLPKKPERMKDSLVWEGVLRSVDRLSGDNVLTANKGAIETIVNEIESDANKWYDELNNVLGKAMGKVWELRRKERVVAWVLPYTFDSKGSGVWFLCLESYDRGLIRDMQMDLTRFPDLGDSLVESDMETLLSEARKRLEQKTEHCLSCC